MSAYIVENGTIQRALYALQSLQRPFYGKDLTKDEDLAELGQELYRLNTKAVNARYRSRRRVPKYVHEPVDPTTSVMQLYKSLCCLIYQCSEDKADRTFLYKELLRARADLAVRLLSETQEYLACGWL